jgi:membrane protease YdiL (CAAX protease family)
MTLNKVAISFTLFLAGCAVFVLGNPYYRIFPTNWNQKYYLVLSIFFLLSAVVSNRIPALHKYWPAAFSFFLASIALVVLKAGYFNIYAGTSNPVKEIALDKFSQFLHIVPIMVILTLLVKSTPGSIFLKTGNLKTGLIFGLVSFVVFAVITFLTQGNLTKFNETFFKSIPWLLLFIFSNAIMEELWFRGIFLNTFDPLVGRTAAIIITALLFGISHINATYDFPGGSYVFGVVVFILGAVGAYMMFKTDSIIGPILFHAGYDLIIILPVINSM